MPPDESPDYPIVAYDFETTRIPKRVTDPMRVQPRFITFHGERWAYDAAPRSYEATASIFEELWSEFEPNTNLCAFNANRYDLRILLQALLGSRFTLEPFTSKVSGLRGCIVRYGRKRVHLLDPIAMLGLQCDLRTFINVFAPEFPKGRLDFDRIAFNAKNPAHVEYAKRDSEALYHAVVRAQATLRGICGQKLRPTIGAVAIRAFAAAMPKGVAVPALRSNLYTIVRKIVARGGYVVARRYKGKLWTYDLNQAYAFAMRECSLPFGRALPTNSFCSSKPGFYRVKLRRSTLSAVPYMVRESKPPYRTLETYGAGCVTWLTSDEVSTLIRHGWECGFIEGYVFEGGFSMTAFVDGLEARRKQFDSTHPVNVLCKAIGCNAYGKTLQEPVTMKIVLSPTMPKGAFPMVEANAEGAPVPGFWLVPERKDTRKNYERPQLGAFITAFVRCVLFDAIMGDVAHFVKADTDSVSFSRPQPHLPLSKWKYGAWKIESDGEYHIVVAKKVYWTPKKIVAKGMRTRKLSRAAFERWHKGDVPVQEQIQLQSWKKGALAPAWRVQRRRGTRVEVP